MELLLLFVTESHGNSDVPNTDTREQILFLLAKSRGNPDVLTGGAEELDQEENHGGKVEEEKAAVEVVRQLPPLPPFVRCYKCPPFLSPFTVVASPPPSALLLLLLLLLLLTLATGGASEAALEGAGDVRPLCFREACVRHL